MISRISTSRVSGEPIVILTMPVFAADGSVAAMLGGSLRLSSRSLLDDLTQEPTDRPSAVTTIVVDAKGQILSHPMRDWVLARRRLRPGDRRRAAGVAPTRQPDRARGLCGAGRRPRSRPRRRPGCRLAGAALGSCRRLARRGPRRREARALARLRRRRRRWPADPADHVLLVAPAGASQAARVAADRRRRRCRGRLARSRRRAGRPLESPPARDARAQGEPGGRPAAARQDARGDGEGAGRHRLHAQPPLRARQRRVQPPARLRRLGPRRRGGARDLRLRRVLPGPRHARRARRSASAASSPRRSNSCAATAAASGASCSARR